MTRSIGIRDIGLLTYITLIFTGGYLAVFAIGSTPIGVLYVALLLIPIFIWGSTLSLRIPAGLALSAVGIIACTAVSAIYNDSPLAIVAASMKVTMLPLLALLVGLNLGDLRSWEHCRIPLFVLVLGNALAAGWQVKAGVDGLIEYGYEYGDTVRIFDGAVRAFGLLPRDNIAAQTMAVVLIFAIWHVSNNKDRRALYVLIALSALILIILSRNRTALLAVILGIWMVLPRGRVDAGLARFVFAFLAAGSLAIGVQLSLLGTGNSLIDRLSVWANAVSNVNALFGGGPGTVGVTAFTTLAGKLPIENPGDNYFVTTAAQFGLLGFISLGFFIFWLFSISKMTSGPTRSLAVALVVFFTVSLVTNNTFEEVPSALFLFLLLGCAISEGRYANEDCSELPIREAVNHWSATLRA